MNRQDAFRYLLYFALFSLFSTFFFIATFPGVRMTAMVNGQLRSLSNGSVAVTKTSLSFPWSVHLKGVTTSISGETLDLGDATVSPDLAALFTGRKGVKVKFAGIAGMGKISIRTSKAGGKVVASPLKIDLSGLSRLIQLPVQLEGLVAGEVTVETGDISGSVWSGEGTLSAGSIIMSGPLLEAFGMAPFNLSGLKLFFTLDENLVKLGENEVQGDIGAKIRGTMKLDPRRPEKSRLDLVVELHPTAANREKLSPVLTIMGARPNADGSVQLKVKGTVGRPSVTP
jgi:type II secretion system protein N